MLKIVVCGLALSFAGAASAAAPQALSRFDASQAASPVEKLVLCDLSAFVQSRPNLDANVIYARRERQNRYDPLLGPNFVSGGAWYSEDYEDAYRRLLARGRGSFKEVAAAQSAYGPQMIRRGSLASADRRFLETQARYCRALIRSDEMRGRS